jgi:uncharacterized damage-inducible protein DinB
MSEFNAELTENTAAIAGARTALLDRLRRLSNDELIRGRRGGWTVRDVLRHVIDAEVAYAKVIAYLRSSAVDLVNATDEDVASRDAAIAALERARAQLLALLDGIDEQTFYDLRALGKEQYSVVSVLENVASHDHEHLEQIEKILAS